MARTIKELIKLTIMNSVLELRESEVEFPLLAITLDEKILVLFVSHNAGTCIDKGISIKNKVGEFRTDWIDVRNTKTWRILPFGSKITLIQS